MDEELYQFGPVRSLDRLLRAARRHWLRLAAVFVLCLGAAGAYLALAPAEYTAQAVVMLAPRQADIAATDTVATDQAVRQPAAGLPDVEGEIEIMKSPAFLARIAEDLRLEERMQAAEEGALLSSLLQPAKDAFGAGRAWVASFLTSPESTLAPSGGVAPLPPVVDRMGRRLKVSPVGRSTMVQIRFRAAQPALAAEVANEVARRYLEERHQARVEEAERAAGWLRERAADLQRAVAAADRSLAEFRIRAQARGRDLQQLAGEMSTLTDRIVEAEVERGQATSRLAAAEARVRRDGILALLDWEQSVSRGERYVDRLRSSLAEGRQEAARLSAEFGSRHPNALRAQAQVNMAQEQVEAEARGRLRGFELAVDSATRHVRSLEASLQSARAEANRLEIENARLSALQREADTQRAIYEAFVARWTATEQVGLDDQASRLASPAYAPLNPSWPNLPLVLIASFVAATGIGLSGLLFRELKGSRTLRSTEDVLRCLKPLRPLGMVPELPPRAERNIADAVHAGAQPLFAEATSSLYASLVSAGRLDAGQDAPAVLLCSALPHEGKSVVAASLAAAAAALDGRKVVLVDCDLRKPCLHGFFSLSNERGLCDYLRGDCTADELLQLAPRSGVWLVPAGSLRESRPSALLKSPRMAQLLERLRQDHALVLIDAPPVLGVPDSRIVARLVDHAVLLARWAVTPWATSRLAAEVLRADGISVLGAALSRVDLDQFTRFDFPDAEPFRRPYLKYYVSGAGRGTTRLAARPL